MNRKQTAKVVGTSPPSRPHPISVTTAYYFATSLSRALRIPVGIISSAYGGATVEGWISRELLENYPDISLNPDSIERLHPMHRPMLMYNAIAEAASELYHKRDSSGIKASLT